jgi:hypothetical protein
VTNVPILLALRATTRALAPSGAGVVSGGTGAGSGGSGGAAPGALISNTVRRDPDTQV